MSNGDFSQVCTNCLVVIILLNSCFFAYRIMSLCNLNAPLYWGPFLPFYRLNEFCGACCVFVLIWSLVTVALLGIKQEKTALYE